MNHYGSSLNWYWWYSNGVYSGTQNMKKATVRGGALTLFVLVYFFNPANPANATTVVQHNTFGISLSEYEARLKRREREISLQLTSTHTKEQAYLQTQLQVFHNKLTDNKAAYEEYIIGLKERIDRLEQIRGHIQSDLLEHAKVSIIQGNTQQADTLFSEFEAHTQEAPEAIAEDAYQRDQTSSSQ